MNSSKIKKYVGLIESSNVYDVAQITPVTKANQLSKLLKNEVLLKREDLQPIFSFKIRGAYNKLSKLKQKGIKGPFIAASAGNHAQGVAFGAKSLGLKAYIVMPILKTLDEYAKRVEKEMPPKFTKEEIIKRKYHPTIKNLCTSPARTLTTAL